MSEVKKPTPEEVALANKIRFQASRSPDKPLDEELLKSATSTQVDDKAAENASEEVTEDNEKAEQTVNTKTTAKKTTRRKPVNKQD